MEVALVSISGATRQGLSCFHRQWKLTVVVATESMEPKKVKIKKVNATLWQVFNLIRELGLTS